MVSNSKLERYIKHKSGDDRKTTYPIGRPDIFEFYTRARSCFWVPNEIVLDVDKLDYKNKLNDGERHFVKTVLGFFSTMDNLVNENIVERFEKEFDIYEIGMFYHFQVAMEDIHAETYSLLLDTLISDPEEKDRILKAAENVPIIAEIASWVHETVSSTNSIGSRLVRMICIEGLLFIGCFCAIYWLQERGLMPGLAHSNELIARDESLHTLFACHLYSILESEHKISDNEIYHIVDDAIAIADRFSDYALPKGLKMMNSTLMSQYLRFTADNILTMLNLTPRYNATNEFDFMKKSVLSNKTLFFDRRVSEYSKANNDDDEDSDEDSDEESDEDSDE